jgi:thioredoxin-like negative regulator of GroEL
MSAAVAALLMQGVEGGGLPLVTSVLDEWTIATAGEASRFRVPVIIEAGGASLMAPEQADQRGALDLELYLYALDDSGTVAEHLARTVEVRLDRLGEALSETGVRFIEDIELAPGDYSLRILVLEPISRLFGLKVEEVTVSGSETLPEADWIAPPRIQSSCAPWLVARLSGSTGFEVQNEHDNLISGALLGSTESRPVLVSGRPSRLSAMSGVPAAGSQSDSTIAIRLAREGATGNTARVESVTVARLSSGRQLFDVVFEVPLLPEGLYQLAVIGPSSGADEDGPRSPTVDVWLTGKDDAATDCPTWTRLRQRSLLAESGAQQEELRTSAGNRRRRAAIRAAYLDVLKQLAATGDSTAAVESLGRMEQGIIESGPQHHETLFETELVIVREMATSDPECLLPILTLHHEAYESHYQKGRFRLAGASRRLIAEAIDWFIDEMDGAVNTGPLTDLMTSLAEYTERHLMMFESQILLRRALELQPEHVPARLLLALSYERVGFHERARGQLEELLRHNAKMPEARLRQAVMLVRQGDFEVAVPLLRRLIRERPEEWVLALSFQTLAQALGRLGRQEEALATLWEAVARLPDEQKLHVQLAYWLDRRGRRLEATEVLAQIPIAERPISSHRLRYTEHTSSIVEPMRRQLAANVSVRLPRLAVVVSQAARDSSE